MRIVLRAGSLLILQNCEHTQLSSFQDTHSTLTYRCCSLLGIRHHQAFEGTYDAPPMATQISCTEPFESNVHEYFSTNGLPNNKFDQIGDVGMKN